MSAIYNFLHVSWQEWIQWRNVWMVLYRARKFQILLFPWHLILDAGREEHLTSVMHLFLPYPMINKYNKVISYKDVDKIVWLSSGEEWVILTLTWKCDDYWDPKSLRHHRLISLPLAFVGFPLHHFMSVIILYLGTILL